MNQNNITSKVSFYKKITSLSFNNCIVVSRSNYHFFRLGELGSNDRWSDGGGRSSDGIFSKRKSESLKCPRNQVGLRRLLLNHLR